MTRSDWIEYRIRWNNQIDEFERLWACWVSEKRASQIHWRIEEDIWELHARMLHASIVPERVGPAVVALRGLVDEFRVALEEDPHRQRKRRFTVQHDVHGKFRLSEKFPFASHDKGSRATA